MVNCHGILRFSFPARRPISVSLSQKRNGIHRWDFHSLMLAITLVFSFMLTDTDNPIHMCKNCGKVFIAEKQDSLFCSAECKSQYRAQKKQEKK
jgi:hypothetical protein